MLNRPFPSSLLPLFQNGSWCTACHGNEFDLRDKKRAGKTYFHMKGCAPELILKQAKGNSEVAYSNPTRDV